MEKEKYQLESVHDSLEAVEFVNRTNCFRSVKEKRELANCEIPTLCDFSERARHEENFEHTNIEHLRWLSAMELA